MDFVKWRGMGGECVTCGHSVTVAVLSCPPSLPCGHVTIAVFIHLSQDMEFWEFF